MINDTLKHPPSPKYLRGEARWMKLGVILANALTLDHGQLSGKSFLISALYTDNEAAIRPLDLKVGYGTGT
jgi:hypothetical protein